MFIAIAESQKRTLLTMGSSPPLDNPSNSISDAHHVISFTTLHYYKIFLVNSVINALTSMYA